MQNYDLFFENIFQKIVKINREKCIKKINCNCWLKTFEIVMTV